MTEHDKTTDARSFDSRVGDFVLGSGSPRRLELLRRIGIEPHVVVPDVDEAALAGESAEHYLERIVRDKKEAVRRRRVGRADRGGLVADTTVVHQGTLLGKPEDPTDALRMLRQLSGATHRVLTAFAVWNAAGVHRGRIVETQVSFRPLGEAELEAYLATGESMDKAGSYGIQGRATAFVDRIQGSYSNVVGLPLSQVMEDLVELDLLGASELFRAVGER